MRRARMLVWATAGLASCAVVAGPVADAATGPKRPRLTVTVNDNYYLPKTKTIAAGTTVRWYWPMTTLDVHDVKLEKAPKGGKKFESDPLAAGQSFTRKLSKPGRYYLICTFHEGMTMTLTVKKPKKAKKR